MAKSQFRKKPVEKHGMSKSREYRAWSDMLTRCYDPNFIKWSYYGGKGVKVCEEWKNSFVAFFRDMGPCPPKHSLDRKDGSKGYCKENCRWTTQAEQMRNTSRTRFITFNGKTQCVADWAIELGMTYSKLLHRLDRGWTLEKALTPKHIKGRPLTFNGQTMNIADWARQTGIGKCVIRNRIVLHGWSIEKALTTPARKKRCSQPKSVQNEN